MIQVFKFDILLCCYVTFKYIQNEQRFLKTHKQNGVNMKTEFMTGCKICFILFLDILVQRNIHIKIKTCFNSALLAF